MSNEILMNRYLILALTTLLLMTGQTGYSRAQNIPPFIGDRISKPKINFPNPLDGRNESDSDTRERAHQNPTYRQQIELRDTLNSCAEAIARNDLEQVAGCYSHKPELVVYWESQRLEGWQAVKEELEKSSIPHQYRSPISDLRISIFGRFAWATGTYEKQVANGSPLKGRLSLVMERLRTRWQILHEHASIEESRSDTLLSEK